MNSEYNSYNYEQIYKPKKKSNGGLIVGLFILGFIILISLFIAGVYLVSNTLYSGNVTMVESNLETVTPPTSTLPSVMPELNFAEPLAEGELTTEQIAEIVSPQTVGIVSYIGGMAAQGGTGIIMSADGYVITNAHVVDGVSTIEIMLNDERTFEAVIVGADTNSDLAVLKILDPPDDLQPATFGDSSELSVGERVVAIGTPGGLAGTVSQGVVSGTQRAMEDITGDPNDSSLPMIQTDAAINPGNSGGPLVNTSGQVIGVTTAKISAVDYEGIGFAISINEAMPVIEGLIENAGKPKLGVTVIPVSALEQLPAGYTLDYGLILYEISESSDVLNYGVMPGDIIVQADGIDLVENEDLTDIIGTKETGDTIDLVVWRSVTGKLVQFPATVTSNVG